jgi:hypothetical protein
MHLTPGMTFDTVQRLAHNLRVSLRKDLAQPLTSPVVSRQPSGVKSLLPRPGSVLAIESQESTSIGSSPPDQENRVLSGERGQYGRCCGHTRSLLEFAGYSALVETNRTRSSSPSVVSIPTRGWASPGGSVFSEPPRGKSPAHGNLEAPPLFPLL